METSNHDFRGILSRNVGREWDGRRHKQLTLALDARAGKVGFIDEIMSAYRVHRAGMWSGKAASNQVIGFMETMAQVHGWIPEAHQQAFGEKLGHHLAYPFSWNKPCQLGPTPSQNLALVARILQTPGAETAFVEQLEHYRAEAERLNHEREGKLTKARDQVTKLKGKLENERAKVQALKESKAKPRRWFHLGPKSRD